MDLNLCYLWLTPLGPNAPAGPVQPLPIGVQIIGRRFDDIGVLAMAKAFEGLRGAQRPWPVAPAK